MGTTHFSGLNLKVTAIPEGAAGNHTVTGITTDDVLIAVIGHKMALNEAAPPTMTITAVNLTSEFTISAADTIENGGHTSLADTWVLVFWLDVDAS